MPTNNPFRSRAAELAAIDGRQLSGIQLINMEEYNQTVHSIQGEPIACTCHDCLQLSIQQQSAQFHVQHQHQHQHPQQLPDYLHQQQCHCYYYQDLSHSQYQPDNFSSLAYDGQCDLAADISSHHPPSQDRVDSLELRSVLEENEQDEQEDQLQRGPTVVDTSLAEAGATLIDKKPDIAQELFEDVEENEELINEKMREINKNYFNQRRRKDRTMFTKSQIGRLEREFQSAKYLTRLRRYEISLQLALTERQVKVWFQNRRMKSRRIKESSSGSCTPSSPKSSPSEAEAAAADPSACVENN